MLANRIARLAARMGIPVASVVGNAHLGLADSVRVTESVPLVVGPQAELQLSSLEATLTPSRLLEILNTSIVWVGCEATEASLVRASTGDLPEDGFSLVFCCAKVALRCVTDRGGGMKVLSARPPRRIPGELMFAGRFVLGPTPGFDASGLCEIVASQRRVLTTVNRAEVRRHEVEEREFIAGARRYLEALRTHAEHSRPVADYVLVCHDPIRLRIERQDVWPATFCRPGTRLELPTPNGGRRMHVVADLSDDNEVLTLDAVALPGQVLTEGEVKRHPNDDGLRRMREALDVIAMGQDPAHDRLLAALTRPESLDDIEPPSVAAESVETQRQERAVALGLVTPDIARIHGPPGTGKTTVISRLVEELVRAGKKVLLVAPTHVALDNVLERVGSAEGVTAIRLGEPSNVDVNVRRYLVRERKHDLSSTLQKDLLAALERSPDGPIATVQREWAERIANDDELGALLLLRANLVCATPIGIAMAREFRDVGVAFDVMIMDEASKATITDFLVPAARAKKWILVGDAQQLPPYVDMDDLEAVIRQRVHRAGFDGIPEDWEFRIAVALRRHFDQRMHPSESRRDRAWRELVSVVALNASAAAVEQLVAFGPDPGRWRRAQVDGVDESLTRLGAELLELQALALPSVFEHLARLPESRSVRLNFQHRMAPALAEFSSEVVYGGDYPSASDTEGLGFEIPTLEEPSIWLDTSMARPERRFEQPRDQDWRGGNYSNALELDVAIEVIGKCARWAETTWHGDHRPNGRGAAAPFEIGVICCYRQQAQLIRDEVSERLGAGPDQWRRTWRRPAANGAAIDIHVSIVDRFQGREKDLVILCTTRSNPVHRRGHVDNLNRLNVAATRARHKRIIIGDSATLADARFPADDLLRRLYETSARRVRWGKALGDKL